MPRGKIQERHERGFLGTLISNCHENLRSIPAATLKSSGTGLADPCPYKKLLCIITYTESEGGMELGCCERVICKRMLLHIRACVWVCGCAGMVVKGILRYVKSKTNKRPSAEAPWEGIIARPPL